MSEVQAGQKSNGQVEAQQPPAAAATAMVRFDPENATEAWQLARYYGASNLIPASLRATADIFVTIMAGRDFGWSPMQSIRGIHVVEGKPSLAADAMVAVVKRSGLCEFFRLVKSDDLEAIYETKRKGDPEPVRMGFTIKQAEAAGLLAKKGPWHTYRSRMLRNRAKSVLCKEVYEDLFFGVWEADEAHEVEALRALPAGEAGKGTEGLKAALKASETTVVAAPAAEAATDPDAEEQAEILAKEAEEEAARVQS